jgi:hypothetical protein
MLSPHWREVRPPPPAQCEPREADRRAGTAWDGHMGLIPKGLIDVEERGPRAHMPEPGAFLAVNEMECTDVDNQSAVQ